VASVVKAVERPVAVRESDHVSASSVAWAELGRRS
jgi:hypothetical protein